MKKMIIVCGVMLAVFNLHSESKPNVEAVIYLDTEMPCLKDEVLSGRIVISNNGNDDIKLLQSEANPDSLVHEQLFLFPNISSMEKEQVRDLPLKRRHLMQNIKDGVDYEMQVTRKGKTFVTLKQGETLEMSFDNREIYVVQNAVNRLEYTATLYLPPTAGVPVEICPPISVAYDAQLSPIANVGKGGKRNNDSPWRLFRVYMDTSEFLYAKTDYSFHRLLDLYPGDTVVHSNKIVTVTREDGKMRVISEADLNRIRSERQEERRKNKAKQS